MNTYLILRRGGWRSGKELEEAAARSKRVGESAVRASEDTVGNPSFDAGGNWAVAAP